MSQKYFIAGTDTNVGKTQIAAQLCRQLVASKATVAALKPIASGCWQTDSGWQNEDTLALHAAVGQRQDLESITPLMYPEAISPHLAAKHIGETLSVQKILNCCETTLNQTVDYLVIEGAGGWLNPINAEESLADFAQVLGCQVILVVGMRLGCLNHTLLTVENIKSRGLVLAGWVANCIDPKMQALEENIAGLQTWLAAPLLATVPYAGHENFKLSL